MKVVISVLGRFHGFDLAREIHAHGALQKLISSYPAFIAKKFGIPLEKYQGVLHWEAMARTLRKIKPSFEKIWNEQYFICEGYDCSVAKRLLEPMDIFVGWSGSSLFSLRKARSLGAKTVLERGSSHILFQTEILEQEYEMLGMKFTGTHPKIIERELTEYKEADFISIPSSYVKQTFLDRGIPSSKLIQTSYGVNLRHFYPPEGKKSEHEKFRIIFCGNQVVQKGLLYLIKAANELQLPDLELWIVGNVSDEIKHIQNKANMDQVIFKGSHPQDQLRKLYGQCDLFCLPSLQEGLAMVIPQAMACALPVLCTENTGGRDIVRDGVDGFIVPIRDIEALKEKILLLYMNRDQARLMGEQAKKRVQEMGSWAHYGARTFSAYERILSGK